MDTPGVASPEKPDTLPAVIAVRASLARLLAPCALAVCLLPEAAAADPERAQRLFDEGLDAMLAGDFEAGCEKLSESLRVDFSGGTLFTLAECRAKQGKVATAVDRYSEYVEYWNSLGPKEQVKHRARFDVSTSERAELIKVVPTIKLLLPAWAPEGTVVMKNGVILARGMLGRPLRVDPGEHIFVTQAPGDPVTERRTHIARGQHLTMTLPVNVSMDGGRRRDAPPKTPERPRQAAPPAPTATAPAAPPARDDPPTSRRGLAFVVGGVGVAGFAVGSVTGAMTLAKRDTILEQCDGRFCTPEGKDSADSAQRLALVSTVGFGVGIAGVTTAVVLLLLEPPPESRASVTPTVGAVGTGGGFVGARGRW